MTMVRQIVIVLVLIALSAGAWWYLETPGSDAAQQAGEGPPAVPVEVAEARRGEVSEVIEAVGTTRPRQSIEVIADDSGRVDEILFETGQRVEQGQPLVRLDRGIQEANLAEAEAVLVDARAQLERARRLVSNSAVSEARVDELRAAFLTAEARVAAERQRLRDRTVNAPFAGIVGLREVDVGARVTDSTVLTRLDDLSVIELEFAVPERFFGAIRQGQPVSATSTAFPDTDFTGAVAAIDTRIDAVSRSFRVRAEFPNPEGRLPGGLFMLARVTLSTRPDAILVPEEAVLAEGRSNFVYRIVGTPAEPRAERVEIRLGQRRVGEVEVVEGIGIGDRVVTAGLQRLRPGSAVRLPTVPAPTSEDRADKVAERRG
ncbi:efflux RND transporter periplasmic adaptor subunit [Skermanella mucosa]|uniref:efflux RND transporter periplasmic adaptor subunit n=1 Tax=Skermanella mucosa TaxID=1789672 RepID=UPI00192C98A0|nr:efflux RND transporter periplasmic adaptor subunit [Skermanella mucosa]UEM22399.1 efflux RND transporter periplasmic adaptor subunit [Skermanella mucosa]